jgi:mannosyl-3-phosphoglycerate phosphatase
MQWIIFSDLDGSLLNYHDYSFDEAKTSLKTIQKLKIPLILTTSKTRAEVELIMREMELEEPFIVENGAAIFFPVGYRGWRITSNIADPSYNIIHLGMPYLEIRRFVMKAASRFGIKGFGDLSVEEIAELTGLPYDKAILAKKREFTEPFYFGNEKDMDELLQLALAAKIKIVQGGICYHFVGLHQDKGKAVQSTKDIIRRHVGKEVRAVGIGDSANDIPMLEHVDIPVLIPHANGRFETVELPNLIKARSPGSRGWNEVMEGILNDIEGNRA